MATKKRLVPSFRPNLRLSHFIYPGPEKRDYEGLVSKVARDVAEGRIIDPKDDRRNERPSNGRTDSNG